MEKRYSVLICDDSPAVHKSMMICLREENIQAISAYSAEEALQILRQNDIKIIILDIMLPGINGLEACREIRKTNSDIYMIMLSAKDEEVDRIVGLEVGADEYVSKPFSPRELSLHIKKLLGRMSAGNKSMTKEIVYGNVIVEPDSYQAFCNSKPLNLTPKEIKLLCYMINHVGKVVNRDTLLNEVWGIDYFGDIRAVDSLMKRLRQKLDAVHSGIVINSVYGIGYRLEK